MNRCCHIPVSMLSSVVAKPLTNRGDKYGTVGLEHDKRQSSLITQARCGDELLGKITVH